jgi:hypothetical protein
MEARLSVWAIALYLAAHFFLLGEMGSSKLSMANVCQVPQAIERAEYNRALNAARRIQRAFRRWRWRKMFRHSRTLNQASTK